MFSCIKKQTYPNKVIIDKSVKEIDSSQSCVIDDTNNKEMMILLISVIDDKKLDHAKIMMKNMDRFDFVDYGHNIYIRFLTSVLLYEKDKLNEICNIFFDNVDKLPSINIVCDKISYLNIIKNNEKYNITFSAEMRSPYSFNLFNLRPKTLLFMLKTYFIDKEKLPDYTDITLDLFNKIQFIQEKKDPGAEYNICSICYTNQKNVLFSDCNHVISCDECSAKILECPACKKIILSKRIIYIL